MSIAAIATAFASAASNSSADSNDLATLGLTASNPPIQAELQAVGNKLAELINALRWQVSVLHFAGATAMGAEGGGDAALRAKGPRRTATSAKVHDMP